MEILSVVLLCLCMIMLGVILWLVVRKWDVLSQEDRDILFTKGIELLKYVKTAWANDGKIDMIEWDQIYKYLVAIIAYLGGKSEYAVKLQSGTENLQLTEKSE